MARLEAVIIVAGAFMLIGACGQNLDERTKEAAQNHQNDVSTSAPTQVETVPPDESSDDRATDDSDSRDEATDESQDSSDDSATDDSSDASSDDEDNG